MVKFFCQERIFGSLSSPHGPHFLKSRCLYGLQTWVIVSGHLYLRLSIGRKPDEIKWKQKMGIWVVYVTKTFFFSITLSKNNGAQNTLALTTSGIFLRMLKEKKIPSEKYFCAITKWSQIMALKSWQGIRWVVFLLRKADPSSVEKEEMLRTAEWLPSKTIGLSSRPGNKHSI